jgi:hypothetical protein
MTTRIHFPYGVNPSPVLVPAFESAWERTTNSRYACAVSKQGSAFNEASNSEYNVAAQYDAEAVQFISGPLRAQTINGTVKGQFMARQSHADADFCLALIIKVVTAVGITRGVLLSYFPGSISTELPAGAPVNRYCPPSTALTELAIEDGDRLVIEIGFRSFNTVTTTYYGYLTLGDGAASDLPEDETETEYLNPWIEFSGNLQWISETALVATGSIALSAPSALGSSTLVDDTVTALAADTTSVLATGMVLCGESAINSIPPAQFYTEGHMELSAPCAIDSILPTITRLAAAGSFSLSGPSIIGSPSNLITALATQGHMSLSSRSAIGGAEQLAAKQTDLVATGGYRLSGTSALETIQPAGKVTALAASGGYSLGGECALNSPVATVTALAGTISYILSGQATSGVILPLVTHLVATGGYILGSSGVEPEETVFEAWVLNGQAFEPAIFSAFRFNSFAQRGPQTFAAGEDGIYLLGGDDDDGEAFHTGARIGPANFGTDREKRMRSIQMGNCGPDTKVRVVAEMGDRVFTPDIDSNRVVVSRDIQGREFTIDIQDFQELSHFEATVLKLARR